MLLRSVRNFAETALRLPFPKRPVCHAISAEEWPPVRLERRRRKNMSCGWSAAVCGLICHLKRPSQCCWMWRFRWKWIAYFCAGYCRSSGGLSYLNFKPVYWTKLPCYNVCYKGAQLPVSSDVSVFSQTLSLTCGQKQYVRSTQTGPGLHSECHSPADRNMNVRLHV